MTNKIEKKNKQTLSKIFTLSEKIIKKTKLLPKTNFAYSFLIAELILVI